MPVAEPAGHVAKMDVEHIAEHQDVAVSDVFGGISTWCLEGTFFSASCR
jgi:hypothetical protein